MSLPEYFLSKFGSLDILFDSHCHLSWFDEKSLSEVVAESKKAGVMKIIDIAVDLNTSKKTLENAKRFPGVVYPTAGIDPEIAIPGSELFIKNLDMGKIEDILTEFEEFVNKHYRKLIMIGECGLDYYWIYKSELSEDEIKKSKQLQQRIFTKQIELAEKYSLPLSIHHRDSLEDCLLLLKGHRVSGIFHSFTGNVEDAKSILTSGFVIGINGIVTYRSAENIRQAVKNVLPDNKPYKIEDIYKSGVFFETDAPFLAPRGVKDRKNSPKNIRVIVDFLQGSGLNPK